MSGITIGKNHEGAWVLDAMCFDGYETFLHTMRFYDYTKAEAIKLFKSHCLEEGLKILTSEDEYV